jgi:hypothetical protein
MTIKWQVDKATSTAVSDCGDYTIEINHVAGECFYEGFFRKSFLTSNLDRDFVIQVCKDDRAARALHVEHRHENGDGL